jgi:dTDP-4-amino-4,6-dideoxygalactose transaminase
VVEAGFKYNMMDLQAAIGLHQLQRVDRYWQRRQEIWQYYNEAFARMPLTLPPPPAPGTRHSYHLYTVLVDKARTGISRDAFLEGMSAQNIGVGVHYLSIPEHRFYQENFNWKPSNYREAMRLGRQTVSLPLSPKLSDQDADDVIEGVKRVVDS